jgi:hypothetical protein
MRRLNFNLDPHAPEEVLRTISVDSSNRILCRGLQGLTWVARPFSLPLYRLFVSPRLTAFSFTCRSFGGRDPDEVFSNLTSMIAELPTSSLQSFPADLYLGAAPIPMDLKSAVSSVVFRCDPSLATLSLLLPLSDVAVQQIMNLPLGLVPGSVLYSSDRGSGITPRVQSIPPPADGVPPPHWSTPGPDLFVVGLRSLD